MDVTYKNPLSLSRLRNSSARRWLSALLIALLIEGTSVYYFMQKSSSLYTNNSSNSVLTLDPLTLDPLLVAALFPTKVTIEPVSIKSSISKKAALAIIPAPKSLANNKPASSASTASSPDGSVIISPDAPGSGTAIDVGGLPSSEPTAESDSTTPISNTNTSSTGSTSGSSTGTTSATVGTGSGGTTVSAGTGSTTTTTTTSGSTTTSSSVTIPTVSVPPVPTVGGTISIP